LDNPRFRGVSIQQVQHVVSVDEKGRLSIMRDRAEGGGLLIRANQGHSIEGVILEEQLLTRIDRAEDIPICVHGTSLAIWPSIRENGLHRMNRMHIHFAAGLPGVKGVVSGIRRDCQVLIYVDVALAMADGITFFRSSNNHNRSSTADARGRIQWKTERFSPAVKALWVPAPLSSVFRDSNPNFSSPWELSHKHTHTEKPVSNKGYWRLPVCSLTFPANGSKRFGPMEIIEFPTILMDARSLEVLDEFRAYVRPVRNPILTPFCTSLTGIQQLIDGAVSFEEALRRHTKFMRRNSCLPGQRRSCFFITCGDWDLKRMLPSQCELIGADMPEHFKTCANIKEVFREVVLSSPPRWRRESCGIPAMLSALRLKLEGRHHSGRDDCRNLVRIVQALCRRLGR
ncbi:unnamed protein product, partial [Ascophyllum nodosum]